MKDLIWHFSYRRKYLKERALNKRLIEKIKALREIDDRMYPGNDMGWGIKGIRDENDLRLP
jgi:hypothetical protein